MNKIQQEPVKYYILKEKEIIPCSDHIEWCNWIENSTNERIVNQTIIGEKMISTVFLGIDHSFQFREYNRDPILFETMIFNKDGTTENFQERYSTYHEALEGHNKILKRIKKGEEI
jgi:hypothetical protein